MVCCFGAIDKEVDWIGLVSSGAYYFFGFFAYWIGAVDDKSDCIAMFILSYYILI